MRMAVLQREGTVEPGGLSRWEEALIRSRTTQGAVMGRVSLPTLSIGPPVCPGLGGAGGGGQAGLLPPNEPVHLPGPTSSLWTWASTT